MPCFSEDTDTMCVCVFFFYSHTHSTHARTRRARRSHWRPRVSMQVIERDRRAPECHTWAPGGRRTTEVGRIQPFAGQPFTMERNQQPGLAGPCQDLPTRSLLCVQSADSAVWKLLPVCVSVQGCACTSPSINPALSVCARACADRNTYARVHVLGGGGGGGTGHNGWFQKEVSHCQQEHRLCVFVCEQTKQSAVSLSYAPVWPRGGRVCVAY